MTKTTGSFQQPTCVCLDISSERSRTPICEHSIIKQLWCATLQAILITDVHTWLLLTHNESLCVHQQVEMMKATLFSCTGSLGGGDKVSLCASSAQPADTRERPSLLAQSSPCLDPPRTHPPPLRLYMLCTREPTLTPEFLSPNKSLCRRTAIKFSSI